MFATRLSTELELSDMFAKQLSKTYVHILVQVPSTGMCAWLMKFLGLLIITPNSLLIPFHCLNVPFCQLQLRFCNIVPSDLSSGFVAQRNHPHPFCRISSLILLFPTFAHLSTLSLQQSLVHYCLGNIPKPSFFIFPILAVIHYLLSASPH
jgi:hypothetical protein